MISLHNITTVARYEAKILRRSWLFRLFALGALFILVGVNIGVVSPIGDEQWEFLAIPSSIPYMNLYLLNIGQALIIVFLAADFLKKDKKLDTNEVLYTRSMSNLEYLLGKSWGIVRLFLSINILILTIALIVNIIAKNTYVDLWAYLSNILIVSVPTIIFSLGFAYIMMSIVKNQAITFLLLLGYAALDMFYLYFRAGSLFDYMLFGFPVFKSQIIGYDNLPLIVAHRLLYTLLGFSFIFITILIFNRLPQSRFHRGLTIILLIGSLLGAGYSGYFFYDNHLDSVNRRATTLEVNKRYEDWSFLSVDTADIDIKHINAHLEAEVEMVCTNNSSSSISEIIFSLNPSLKVSEARLEGTKTDFSRDEHILIINPGKSISPGESINISLTYTGSIDEAYCYPWYEGNLKDDGERVGPIPIGQRQTFLYNDYVMLTSETNWYPVASLNYYPSNPARIKVDFTNYSLSVTTKENLVSISQGVRKSNGNTTKFYNETPLSGISLIIGDYTSISIDVDSVEFTAWYKPGNDFFKTDLNEIGDTISVLISNVLRELETNFSTGYPFRKLDLVEVPVQFRSIDKKNTQTLAEVQPSIILLPEKLATLNDGDFYRTLKRNKRRMERSNQIVTDKELQVRVFNSFARNSFISGSNFNFRNGVGTTEQSRYLLGPSYYFFKNNFYSNTYPVINAVFESHLQKVEGMGNMGRNFLGGLSESDKANTILNGTTFNDLLATDPSTDTLRIVLTVKGDYLFNLIRSETGVEEFNTWFTDYLNISKFKNVTLERLSSDIEKEFGFDIMPGVETWYHGSGQPGFYFTGIVAKEVVVDNRTKYLVSFEATNEEDTEGIFTVTCRTMAARGAGGGGRGGSFAMDAGGRGGVSFGGPGRGMQLNQVDRIVRLDANQSKRISIILDAQPRAVSINTLSSINNPGEIILPVGEIIKERIAELSDEDIILQSMPLFTEANEIIVDNEDPGFSYTEQISSGRLKKWLGITSEDRDNYGEMFSWWAPEYWQKTVQTMYYGKYIKSAYYTRAGSGERSARWAASISDPGYYDVYTYISGGRGGGGRGRQGDSGNRRGSNLKDLHYTIYNDADPEEVTVQVENAENGWNHLGSYFISSDSATVVLTNLSEGRTVAADAIRWVRQVR